MPPKRKKFEPTGEIGRHFGKFDLDRIGLFDDKPAGPFDEYVQVKGKPRSDFKGGQLLAGPGNDFIEKEFKRIFVGEAMTKPKVTKKVDPVPGRRVMLPPSPMKLHSTPNDWYGCIGKPMWLSPATREAKRKGYGEPPNPKIKPNPFGGPGYVDICINPYPKHAPEPYDVVVDARGQRIREPPASVRFLTTSAPLEYFPPNPYVELEKGPIYVRPENDEKKTIRIPFYVPYPKKLGGHKAGGFGKYPEHPSDPYQPVAKKAKSLPSGSKFINGSPNSRSMYTRSIVDQVTGISCNENNYREYTARVYSLTY